MRHKFYIGGLKGVDTDTENSERKMQTLTKTDIADRAELQGLTKITHSPRGAKLREPLYLRLPETRTKAEEAVIKYLIEGLSWKMPALIKFTLEHKTVLKVATHLWRHCTASTATLYQYIYGIYRYSTWVNISPDVLIFSCADKNGLLSLNTVKEHAQKIDDFVGEMKALKLAPCTTANFVKGIKALYRVNEVPLHLPYHLKAKVQYHDRAPTPEELTKLIDLADIREKVVISMLALAGFRVGTLIKLQYRHVKQDLEQGITPIHIHVEADITKGKYHDYDTFIGPEAVEYLQAYLAMRRRGTLRLPPETITNSTPLIRNEKAHNVTSVSTYSVYHAVHGLLIKANLLDDETHPRYELRPHSLRKYFRTQLGATNAIPIDYVEYWMGHTISTYDDVRMKGIDYMRNLYTQSGLTIRPKTKLSHIQQLKMMIEAWGMNPNEILSKDALASPHRTIMEAEERQLTTLNQALKQAIIKELQQDTKIV